MPDRYRTCPTCHDAQPEAIMQCFWLQAPGKPWRTGYLVRGCRLCGKAAPASAFDLIFVGTSTSAKVLL